MSDVAMSYDLEEQRARIERAQEETRKFAAEQHKLTAEAVKLSREAKLAPWQLTFTGFGAGAAVVGAFAAILKLFGH